MVLAQIVKRKQYEQGFAQGYKEGTAIAQAITQSIEEGFELGVYVARCEHTMQLEAWAKEKGIPLDDLPKLSKPKLGKPKSKRD